MGRYVNENALKTYVEEKNILIKSITWTLTKSGRKLGQTFTRKIISGVIIKTKRASTIVLAWVGSACSFLENKIKLNRLMMGTILNLVKYIKLGLLY
jgi:hypothetical protein